MSKVEGPFELKLYKIMRQLTRHKERYIRAWMLAYGADPRDVVLVTREMGAEGSHFRVEYAKTADPVVELVKAARDYRKDERNWAALDEALKHFEE